MLDAQCDINTKGKMMSDRSTLNGSGEKILFDPEQHNSIASKRNKNFHVIYTLKNIQLDML